MSVLARVETIADSLYLLLFSGCPSQWPFLLEVSVLHWPLHLIRTSYFTHSPRVSTQTAEYFEKKEHFRFFFPPCIAENICDFCLYHILHLKALLFIPFYNRLQQVFEN